MDRDGNWIQLYTGEPFWPLDPQPEDFRIEDIAHALALENRFNGATRIPYSVAEHSVRMAEYVNVVTREMGWGTEAVRNVTLAAVLHDASESLGWRDIARPLKYAPHLKEYKQESKRCQAATFAAFKVMITPEVDAVIRDADARFLATEKRDLMRPSRLVWGPLPDPLPDVIVPWSWDMAERRFLRKFYKYEAK